MYRRIIKEALATIILIKGILKNNNNDNLHTKVRVYFSPSDSWLLLHNYNKVKDDNKIIQLFSSGFFDWICCFKFIFFFFMLACHNVDARILSSFIGSSLVLKVNTVVFQMLWSSAFYWNRICNYAVCKPESNLHFLLYVRKIFLFFISTCHFRKAIKMITSRSFTLHVLIISW